VVGVDGQPIAEPADLLPALDEDRVGREIILRVVRGGELREVRVTIGERGRTV
jgi:S1-C subfamily serine protease